MSDKSRARLENSDDFSLVLGGPLYQLWLRTRLSRPALELVPRRILFFIMLCWIPPFVLSLSAGTILGGVAVPFAHDIVTHARFLIALPIFIAAEYMVNLRLKPIVQLLTARDIIPPAERPRFNAAVTSASRWRNSLVFEVVLLLVTFTVGHFVWMQATSLKASTWYGMSTPVGLQLSQAGLWYAWVSMPIFQFMYFRWYYRLIIWTRFLWQVSKIPLHLVPTHPDRAGGIGFLAEAVPAFAPILMAQGVVLAGLMAGKIFFEGGSLTAFKLDMLGFTMVQALIILGPLCVFVPQLAAARRRGWEQYGSIAARYMDAFDEKWNRGKPAPGEAMLGSGDIQSLADMGNSYNVVREMQVFPFGRVAFLEVILASLLPVAPLVLTLVPLDTLITKLIGIPF